MSYTRKYDESGKIYSTKKRGSQKSSRHNVVTPVNSRRQAALRAKRLSSMHRGDKGNDK